MMSLTTINKIDDATKKRAAATGSNAFRKHLGASVIGRECSRQIYYMFRWFAKEDFDGRMLRLFERGAREEFVFIDALKSIGVQLWTTGKDGKQFRVSFVNGHFGGSTDGVGKGGIDEIPKGEAFVCEFKTHNTKSFEKLKSGVAVAKTEHFQQMQVYMHGFKLKWALYCAVNKDTDELYFEAVQYSKRLAEIILQRAEEIIYATSEPERIANSPGFHKCRYCAFSSICHDSKYPTIKNCRDCMFSSPSKTDNSWLCSKKQPEISTQLGCRHHKHIESVTH